MYAQDRKVIANVTNVEGFRSFDLASVSGYAVGADTAGKVADFGLAAYLIRSGEVAATVTDDKVTFKGVGGTYDEICARLNSETGTNVWRKGDLSKTLQVLCHYVKVDDLHTLKDADLWQVLKGAVQVMDAEHNGLEISGVYKVLKNKDQDGEKKSRGPKSFAELAATAIRQGRAQGMSDLEMLAAFEAMLAE